MMRLCILLASIAVVFGLRANMQMKTDSFVNKAFAGVMASVLAANSFFGPAQALTKDETLSLSYEQVKGSGLANRCPSLPASASGTIPINKKLKVTSLCLEPTSWQVEEEIAVKGGVKKEFVNTKLMTRQTYTLDDVSGSLEVKDGKAVFTEEDGIDYAATTVQIPGGARVPMLFTIKNLVAKSSGSGPIAPGFDLGGSFTVPSYRTGLFLDPKGRGTTTGYDFAGALAARQTGTEEDELFNENNKKFDVLKGDIEFAVSKVDAANGDFTGVFVSNQPSDTDMGAKTPKNILIKGIFYGHAE